MPSPVFIQDIVMNPLPRSWIYIAKRTDSISVSPLTKSIDEIRVNGNFEPTFLRKLDQLVAQPLPLPEKSLDAISTLKSTQNVVRLGKYQNTFFSLLIPFREALIVVI